MCSHGGNSLREIQGRKRMAGLGHSEQGTQARTGGCPAERWGDELGGAAEDHGYYGIQTREKKSP